MMHLAAGLSPVGMGSVPFTPVALNFPPMPASRLGLAGLNPTTLARILGHTDSSFTLRTYCSDQRSVEDVAADVLRASAV